MREAVRQTRSYLMRLFKERGINPRSDLGQNFLIDLNILEFVVAQALIDPTDVILEVGAGTGGMTTFLAQVAAHVVSVEYDRNMYQMAYSQVSTFHNVTLLNRDALKNKNKIAPEVTDEIKKHLAVDPARKVKLIANLPYNIGTAVMSNLVASDLPWQRMVVTIQYELGVKMKARAGSMDYGALSVWLQSQTYVKFLKKIPPSVFWPRPKVNSAVMLIVPKPPEKVHILNRQFFQEFVRMIFTQRRKQLRTTLVSMYKKELTKTEIDQLCLDVGLDQNARAENMDPAKHVELANRFYKALHPDQQLQPEIPSAVNVNLTAEELANLEQDDDNIDVYNHVPSPEDMEE